MLTNELHNALPAGFMRRLMAGLYDWILVLAIMMVASIPFVALTDDAISPGQNWYRLAMTCIAAVFFIAFWSNGGQTLGMRAWRIKLVQADGNPATLNESALRFIAAIVSALPLGLGFIWVLFSAKKISWHDRWSGTRILHLPKK